MIVAERKKIPELVEILQGHKKILVLGCGTCVTVCLAGGEREVSIISSALRIASKIGGHDFEIDELTIERSPFMPVLTLRSSVSWKKGVYGQRNALHVEHVCCISMAESARSHVVPNKC
jgi:ferredoxin